MDKIKEEIRLLIAFVLSILIIFIFSRIQQSKYLPGQTTETKQTQPNQVLTQEIKSEVSKILEGENYEFENGSYYLKFDKKFGYIKEIGLKKFLRKREKFFSLNEGVLIFYNPLVFSENDYLIKTSNNELVLTKDTSGFYYLKKFLIPENDYIFYLEENFRNKTDKDIELKDYKNEIIKINLVDIGIPRSYIPPKIIVGINKLPVFIEPYKVKEQKVYKNCNWVGFSSRYSLIFIYFSEKSTISLEKDGKFLNVNLINESFIIEKNKEKNYKFKFYAGPSDYFVAKDYVKEDIYGHGFFALMGKFLFSVLNSIHKVIPNWGWAIIILTFIIKIVFFPLTRKSLYSMKQLQKLRPYLQDVQKKYKDNPYQLQKELMNIYKEYNINPFAGCLPTIIQIPIFIGFFLALRNSVFLRGASFIFWIKDLSMPDTVFKINNFPVNILPILMTITSYFQQKLTPQTDQSQKSLTVIMPLMFLFILYNFPSGLLLYWVTMNIASLIEQYFISKNFPKIRRKK
ncbi:MAG: membrane protein insertase YidC [Candidatus Omnitrophica bacterium]|nr:membrane protein insertase YidC [Candidatus Omnitrophota bacterium]MCM8802757.1 membrane protein insertase YidC [Candidatus Omnitrophota bacterium]